MNRIGVAWNALAVPTGFVRPDPRFVVLRIADATAEQWEAAGFDRRDVTAWDVHRAGMTLSLATTADEYGRRIAAVQSTPVEAGRRKAHVA